ncbi:MAG TPA: hypothetical protein VG843_02005 [Rhizomicrobium sp.]|jgi:hypothetical protein|nr:hypothetical protein [Rhizomicrobium sp.]
MSQFGKNLRSDDKRENLSDYRVLLSCMRDRFVSYGLVDALERLERLDDAILRAILERDASAEQLALH